MNTSRNISVYKRSNYNTLYSKWCDIHKVCYNVHYKGYNKDINIIVCDAWHKRNPDGFDNFVNWILAEVDNKKLSGKRFERRDKNRGFFPENITIVDSYKANRSMNRVKLDEDKVKQIRTIKMQSPNIKLRELSSIFNVAMSSICRVLRHDAWKQ